MPKTFADVRCAAPPIHAFLPARTVRWGDEEIVQPNETTILEPNEVDEHYEHTPFGARYMEGDGDRVHPYQRNIAASMSAHFGIVDLWWHLHFDLHLYNRTVYIKVNDWIFQVTPEGVVALDGTLTRLG